MKKLRNIIIYIVCGALVAFFGIVFLLAKNPKVKNMARRGPFYIYCWN